MKYIDAEKMKNFLTERFKVCPINDDERHGRHCALIEIENFIDSLQQEQTELPGYDKALLEVKSKVDELYEEASIGLSEYDSGLYNGIAETCMKLRGFIKARLDSDEQPEVDLKKEIDRYCEPIQAWQVQEAPFTSLEKCARHFYELGRNSRKEKIKRR